jgi:hypothetical protein
MATEGPLYRDGAQMQAAANYWNPATKLFGPGGSGQFLAVTVTGPRVLSLVTAATQVVYGFLQNSPDQGQACDVSFEPSVTKVVAGTSLTAGNLLMCDANGRVILWVAAAANYIVGQAIISAGAANEVITMKQFPSITRV